MLPIRCDDNSKTGCFNHLPCILDAPPNILKHIQILCLAHLSRTLIGEFIVYPCSGVRRRRCRRSPFSNIFIAKTFGPNTTKFYLKHHWDEGKAASGFGPDRIRTLVSMASDNSNRVIMGKTASSQFLKGF